MKKYGKRFLFQVLILCIGTIAFSQSEIDSEAINEDGEHETFQRVMEATLEDYYKDYSFSKSQTDSIIAAFGHDYDDVPKFSDDVYCERLGELNKLSPFQLDCNDYVLSNIKFFTEKRRNFTSVVLGRSELYFNMFEEKLAKHDLPLELKYLAVIESGLRPQVKSRAGALGLWQFMFRTGKAYGLDQNSYIDERMDPEMATEAACMYLKKLHSLYDDWNMALAAYNAGPGNVNKAIRRSGGKMTYWEIRPFLPRETQGYVPNFVAMAYMMSYHAEHNITAREPMFHDFEVDTVCLKGGIHMEVIDSLTGWAVEDIQALNPIFKTKYIPNTEKHKCIQIPAVYLDSWIAMEDSIYIVDSLLYNQVIEPEKIMSPTTSPAAITHSVKKGQTLGHIAHRYGTTVKNLMSWNNLKSTNLKIGQKINIYSKTLAVKTQKDDIADSNVSQTGKAMHIVTSGDSLWAIAQKNDTTVENLHKLNPNISKDLKIGQKIRVK